MPAISSSLMPGMAAWLEVTPGVATRSAAPTGPPLDGQGSPPMAGCAPTREIATAANVAARMAKRFKMALLGGSDFRLMSVRVGRGQPDHGLVRQSLNVNFTEPERWPALPPPIRSCAQRRQASGSWIPQSAETGRAVTPMRYGRIRHKQTK